MKSTTRRIGPRQYELCRILSRMGGRAASQSELYMRLSYRGLSSNQYGSEALARCIRAGLIEYCPRQDSDNTPANARPVQLTAAGRNV